MKVLKYTGIVLLGLVIVFYLLPLGLIRIPSVQKKLAEGAAHFIENKIGTDVSIDRVDFRPFNKLVLKNVSVLDQAGDTLFTASRIAAGFELSPLLKKRFRIHSAQLYTFDLRLNKATPDDPLNIQFIIDALQSDKAKEPSSVDLSIRSIHINRGAFSYDVKDQVPHKYKFDPNHIKLTEFSGRVQGDFIKDKLLDIQLKNLKFKEKSGFVLNSLSLDLHADRDSAKVNSLVLKLPDTELLLKDITADYSTEDLLNDPQLHLLIEPSKVTSKDLAAFLSYNDLGKWSLEGEVKGSLNDMTLNPFVMKESSGSSIKVELTVKNLFNDQKAMYIDARTLSAALRKDYIARLDLPEEVKRLGNTHFKGRILGYVHNIKAEGLLQTDIGNLSADVLLKEAAGYSIEGNLLSEGIRLDQLLDNTDLGLTAFKIETNSLINNKKDYSIEVIGEIPIVEYQGYAYDGIRLNGNFTPNGYRGLVSMDGAKGKFEGRGSVVLNESDSEYHFDLSVEDLQLDKLRAAEGYTNPSLSLSSEFDFRGNNFDNIEGAIHLNDFSLSTRDESFAMKFLSLDINRKGEVNTVTLLSDIIDAEIEGKYSTRSLYYQLKRTLAYYLPSLIKNEELQLRENTNNFTFHAIIGDTQDLFSLLRLPIRVSDETILSGYFNNESKQLHAEAFFPNINCSGSAVDSCFIELDNRNNEMKLNILGRSILKKSYLDINANLIARNDSIHTTIAWDSSREERYAGILKFNSQISDNEGLQGNIFIDRTDMIFNDSLWVMHPSHIQLNRSDITIHNLYANHKQQHIRIDGTVSADAEKELLVDLNQVDLEYIFDSLDIPALEFGGRATGVARARDVYHSRILNTDLNVEGFKFNKTPFGDLDLSGRWDDDEQGVMLDGFVAKNDSSYIDINGMIYLTKQKLDIRFNPVNADISFLRKYLNNVAQNISGTATGDLVLHGNLNNPTVSGDVDVDNGRFTIGFLNTYYNFSDHVHLSDDTISINNLTLRDDYGKAAIANGWVYHNCFDDFKYEAKINFNDFFVFNATEDQSQAFYGKAFASGHADIKGTEFDIDISVNARNTDNTEIILNFMDKQDIEEYDFIVFKEKEDRDVPADEPEAPKGKANSPRKRRNGIDMTFALSAEINPDAEIKAVMDPATGDMISGKGKGNLDIFYGTNSPLRINGKVDITEGQYDLSLEQLYFYHFNIWNGSSVFFHGDPMKAELNVRASHTVQANLGDLDQQLLNYTTKSKMPVDCIIDVSGPLEQPNISFDIELRNESSELNRQVKRYMRTEDMINRQILYLLVLKRFYTSPEFATPNTRANNDLSLLTTALSTQLSNLLGSLNDKVQIGTQIHQSYDGDNPTTEVELMMSSALFNNRLIVYGNLGYINNPYINTGENRNVPLVGDFDVEYKLTRSGDIRLKGFNHYNYRNYFSNTPEWTQGVGIMFRRDFNHWIELFRKKKKVPEASEE